MKNSRGSGGSSSSRRKKKAKKTASDSDTTPFLPDDSIQEIVSRLPIKDVIRFGCVSKSAVNLISDRDLIEKHMKRGGVCAPMILVMDRYTHRPLYLLDKWCESNRKKSKIEKKCHLHPEAGLLLSSQDGLIVSTKDYIDYIIFNPIFSETMELSVPSPKNDDGSRAREMLGVFYRPRIKDYSTLWELNVYCTASRSRNYSYEVLDLSSQSNWRKIEYPFPQYYRFWRDEHVLINGFLYWFCMTAEIKFGIMVFDTSIEGFDLIPWPDTAASAFKGNVTTSLLNGNGVLKLVQILDKEFEYDVNVWALNDHVKKIWSSSECRIISRIGNSTRSLKQSASIIALWNEELVLAVREDDGRHQEIFVCNLNLGTTRKFGRRYGGNVSSTSHVMSLAPIKNFKLKVAI